eukprot:10817938-Karenia_brevis.AAC.1
MDAATNNTRHEIVQALENIAAAVRDHDDHLDRMRSKTLENMQRVAGTFRGEAERITDNMLEIIKEIRDRHEDRIAQRRAPDQSEPRRTPDRNVAAIEAVTTRGKDGHL